jgi:carbamoyl-phosphate synthase large subunit
MVNNNPETVSTDFDTSDKLYFEPLTFEDVMNIVENEKPEGVVVQLGGQTSIKLAQKLSEAGVKILGTQVDGIDLAEDRERFKKACDELEIPQPESETAANEEGAFAAAAKIGYPVLIRPSYVIAGRGMEIVHDENELTAYIVEAVELSERKPVLIDRYLDNAIEVEVDAVCDGSEVFIGAIMEHIEPAGVHSGDANIVLPPVRLSGDEKRTIEGYTKKIAIALNTVGLINIQYAVKDGVVYILEANPRASRTVPFVAKSIGIPLVKVATRLMIGEKLAGMDLESRLSHFSVKSVVFPFLKLAGTDTRLGPEMRSTGETMGLGKSFELAYYKALLAAGIKVEPGGALLSLRDSDKEQVPELAGLLKELGFGIYGTAGTVSGILDATAIPKIGKGNSDLLETIRSGKISLIINTPRKGGSSHTDGFKIRRAAIEQGIPCITNINTAFELLRAVKKLKAQDSELKTVDEWAG